MLHLPSSYIRLIGCSLLYWTVQLSQKRILLQDAICLWNAKPQGRYDNSDPLSTHVTGEEFFYEGKDGLTVE